MTHVFYILDRDDDLTEVHECYTTNPRDADHDTVKAAAEAHAWQHGGPVYAFHVPDATRNRAFVHGVATCAPSVVQYRRHGVTPIHETHAHSALQRFAAALQARREWLQACRDHARRNGETAEYAEAFAAWTVGPYWIRSAQGRAQDNLTPDAMLAEWRLVAYG